MSEEDLFRMLDKIFVRQCVACKKKVRGTTVMGCFSPTGLRFECECGHEWTTKLLKT